MKLSKIRKAVAAFLVPVVPAVAVGVLGSDGFTKPVVWGIVIAVLSGLAVYRIPNA